MEFPIPDVGKPYITPSPARMRAMERRSLADTLALVKAYGERLREQGVTRVYIHSVRRAKKGYPTDCLANRCSTVLLESVLGRRLYMSEADFISERLSWCLYEAQVNGIEVVEVADDGSE